MTPILHVHYILGMVLTLTLTLTLTPYVCIIDYGDLIAQVSDGQWDAAMCLLADPPHNADGTKAADVRRIRRAVGFLRRSFRTEKNLELARSLERACDVLEPALVCVHKGYTNISVLIE